MGWMSDAACKDHDQLDAWWFGPETGFGPRHAIAVCNTCPVIDRCLTYAVDAAIWVGVAGGMTPSQRADWARRNSLPRHGTWQGWAMDGCRCHRCDQAHKDGRKAQNLRRRTA